MNPVVAQIVNEVIAKKPEDEYPFRAANKGYVLYPNGEIWRRRGDRDIKKKFTFNGTIWVTEKGRPALIIKDLTTKLQKELKRIAPSTKRTLKTKLPKGAKPTPTRTPKKIDRISSRKKARPHAEVMKQAMRLGKELSKLGLKEILIAGSLRRGDRIVGDIDLMAIGDITKVKGNYEVIKGREKSVTFMYNGHQVNLYSYKKAYAGAMLLFLTGPGEYGVILRRKAKQQDMLLNQYGLWDRDKKTLFAAKTEKAIYKKLGIAYKEPELRSKYREKKVGVEKVDWSKLRKSPDDYIGLLSEDQLVEVIDKASKAYYNTEKSLIEDAVFDQVWDELKRKNPKHPRLRQVGAPVKRQMGKVKLPFYLGSLDKLKPSSADKWLEKNPGPYVVSDKMDGISLGIDTTDGVKLYTRGNGYEGQDISHLVPHLIKAKKLPRKIPDGIQLRCEIEMTEATFKRYFPKDKNARNTMSGLVNQKSIDPSLIKRMDIIAYEVIKPPLKPSDQLRKLGAWGFDVVKWKLVKNLNSGSLSKYFASRKEKCRYAMDGLVVYLDKKAPRVKGENPKHAVAFKTLMENAIATSKVIKIHWGLSKHSLYKPRIEIEPTTLSGVTITFLTAFNAKYVKDNRIGPGAIVKFTRSGDVIPHVLEVVKPAKAPQMPSDEYEWHSGGVEIFKPGKEAEEVTHKKITNFFTTIGVEGFKQRTIERLYKAGFDSVPKILTIRVSELLEIPGIQRKSAEKLRKEIDSAISGVEIHKLAFGSGTFGRTMGSRRLKDIFSRYPDLYKKSYRQADVIEMVKALPGYKEKTATDFSEGLPKFIKFLRSLPKSVKIIGPKKVQRLSTKLEGEVIVFTGFRDNDLQAKIEENGGTVGSGVTKSTTILLLKDPSSSSSKANKARELGISLMSPDQFRTKYNL